MKKVRITIAADSAASPPLAGEFGLSLLVETGGGTVLFDTGAGGALPANLARLRPDFDGIDMVALSHGHYDHTGALAWLLPQIPLAELYYGSGIFRRRFSRHDDGHTHEISMPDSCVRAVDLHLRKREIAEFTEIADGVCLTGPIPRVSGEDCGGDFFFEPECLTRDHVGDEQSLLLDCGVLIQGCCHAGIINTMEYCRRMRPDIKIRTVIGGLHLLHAGERRIAETAGYLAASAVEKLILLHCTGEGAAKALEQQLAGCEVLTGTVGDEFNE